MAEAVPELTVEIDHYIAPELKASSPKTEDFARDSFNASYITLPRYKSVALADYQDSDTKVEDGLFCVAWAPDNKLITAATGDGRIMVVNPDGSIGKVLHSHNADQKLPITALQWRPPSKFLKTEQVLVSGSTNGDIEYWHVPSGKRISSIHEEDNEIYTIDYRPDGQKLATAGKDMCVRI